MVFKNLREEDIVGEEEEEEEEYELDLEELEQAEAEFKQAQGMETYDDDDADDDDDDDFGEVEELTVPMVVDRIVNGNKVREFEVPVIKDDYLLTPSMYCDDIIPTDSKKYFAQKLELSKELLPIEFECSICISACDLTSGGEHQASALPCGHIFGGSCIQNLLQMRSSSKQCPKCNLFCLLDDIRPIRKTSLRIPPVDPKISARRFPLSNHGFLQFHKLETARRNIALIKWSRARMRLDEVLRRVKICSRLADKRLLQAEAWKAKTEAWNMKAEALKRRAKGYNQRVNAHLPRLEYFSSCCENI